MKKKKQNLKQNTNEIEEITKFIKILIIVVIGLLAVYGLTSRAVANKRKEKNEEAATEENIAKFDYNQTIIGSMFNLNYDDYYVIIYKDSARNANLLSDLTNTYRNKEDAKKIFYVNLDDILNKNYFTQDESNKKPKNPSEVKVKDNTLIRFKNNKIVEYYETFDEIYDKLS